VLATLRWVRGDRPPTLARQGSGATLSCARRPSRGRAPAAARMRRRRRRRAGASGTTGRPGPAAMPLRSRPDARRSSRPVMASRTQRAWRWRRCGAVGARPSVMTPGAITQRDETAVSAVEPRPPRGPRSAPPGRDGNVRRAGRSGSVARPCPPARLPGVARGRAAWPVGACRGPRIIVVRGSCRDRDVETRADLRPGLQTLSVDAEGVGPSWRAPPRPERPSPRPERPSPRPRLRPGSRRRYLRRPGPS
jgi:hypothetical protein